MNWESLIGAKIEAHRDTHTVCKIEDASERNTAACRKRATKKWRMLNKERYESTKRAWEKANPDKVKKYREAQKDNIKKWAEEHPDRKRELNRKSDAKRRNSPKRKAWEAAYRQIDEYKERRREYDRKRNQTPERKAYERERRRRREEARRIAKEVV